MGDDDKGSGIWKFVACGCLGCMLPIIGLVVFVAGIGGLAFFGIRSSDAFQEAIDRANDNPAATAALGEPIEAGLIPSGSISVHGSTGQVDLSIPVHGPVGKGTIQVKGSKHDGRWSFEVLELEVEDTGEVIDLLAVPLEREE